MVYVLRPLWPGNADAVKNHLAAASKRRNSLPARFFINGDAELHLGQLRQLPVRQQLYAVLYCFC